MEMPCPARPAHPGLQTRKKPWKTRPAINARLEIKPRHTAPQMAQACKDETTAKVLLKVEAKKGRRRHAALKDKQHQDDLAYAKTANHPADREASSTVATKAASTSGLADGTGDDDHASGDDSEPYVPLADERSSNEESDPDDDGDTTDDNNNNKKKKKKKKWATVTCTEIHASRKTEDSLGTPVIIDDKSKKRKGSRDIDKPRKKAKVMVATKKSGLQDEHKSKSKSKHEAPGADNDCMVAPGGPALDNDTGEHVERPKSSKKKKGAPTAPITIQSIAPKAPTRKEIRGSSAKWTLKHLPPGTSSEFTEEVVPLACELAGTLPPWMGLSVNQIQTIVDKVFGNSVHKVTADTTWVGLIGYRLSDWCSGIAAQAVKAIESIIESYKVESDIEDDEMDTDDTTSPASPTTTSANAIVSATTPVPDAPADAPADADAAVLPADAAADVDPIPAAKPLKFAFNTPEGIAAFVAWALQTHKPSNTMAFQWKIWGGGVDKKGFLQSHLIVYTFAYHLSTLATIPGGYTKLEAPPIGALLLSMQAVHRALQFWETGEYVNPQKFPSFFSIDNWGDTTTSSGIHKQGKVVRRATKFVPMVQGWDKGRWKELKEAAEEWVEIPSCKRAGNSGHSGSEAGDLLVDDDDVMILSD
ncbi:hypothetical protein C8J57DRAFT_1518076 [Mycena rebaudengoi]|nr:hypothetical protein C8J57DRAFT_1518076 [Mycena rebaudengoi]